MSPVLDIPERRGGHWGKNTDTPPHSVPACESQSEARTGGADQSEVGSLQHADLWNNFTLLTPAQATPPSLSQTAFLLSAPRVLSWDRIFHVGQNINIIKCSLTLRHKVGQGPDDYNTLPYRGHKLQILFVPPIKCQHSVMHGPRPGLAELPSSL